MSEGGYTLRSVWKGWTTHGMRWVEMLARRTRCLALHGTKIATPVEQAKFLVAVGVTRPEPARMLGVATETLRSLAHQAESSAKRGGRRGIGAHDE
jgi:hypothetical protein